MSDIFRTAQGVTVWLGEEDEFTPDAFTVIERIARIPRAKWADMSYTGFFDPKGSCYRGTGVEPLTYRNWLGFIAFTNRPWFSRSWVVQELALARKVSVVCGSRTLPWENLARTIEFIRATRWYHHLSTEKMRHLRELNRCRGAYQKFLASNTNFGLEPVYLNSTRNALQAYEKGGNRGAPSLRMLIDTHRHTNATDPRDKVYAFLGLASRTSSSTNQIEPNYETSTRQVYIDAACSLLRTYGNLYLLSHVQDRSLTKTKGLPSWVPDYSVPLSPYPLDFRGRCNWSACGNMKWMPPKDVTTLDRGLLPVQGFHIDTISETAIMPYEATDAGEPWASIVNMVSNLPSPYPLPSLKGAPISRIDVLWRTLTTNTYARQHPAPLECGALFIDYILNLQIRHRLRPWSSNDSEFQPHSTPLSVLTNPDWRSLIESEPNDSPYNISVYRRRLTALVENMLSSNSYTPIDLAQLHHDIENGSGRMRRLFRTSGMMLLGTGPKALRVGDEVWILGGGRVPYILQPVTVREGTGTSPKRQHRLVGEAYVHGLMHGDPARFGRDLQSTVLI
ncbi:hypothetical protein G647_09777 [Cladophialophora carrionii CBS 160.54]|uniref:Heterokaryon incompatibility domain-containing protein n=1 Tax=Cladophialophora carrionii CBS 160.54 TaxID=1279043 RepID=V9DJQ4_9EURO|nr:uncharacterized protein G647_09777 [Cladophialophora carrionii CBS 160.54]ETI27095.1 hypothetical protein G647_09777 [Cladophialophora carrionii CBS 160.54]